MNGHTRNLIDMTTAEYDDRLDREAVARQKHHRTHASDHTTPARTANDHKEASNA